MNRVFLTGPELKTQVGKELLELCISITEDGKLDRDEIIGLRRWLRTNANSKDIAAIPYLCDIMQRVTADKVIDRDELLELHIAIERVIPKSRRGLGEAARKKRQSLIRVKKSEAAKNRRDAEKEARQKERQERNRQLAAHHDEYRKWMNDYRFEFMISKVAGVSFPNDNGSERQDIISKCVEGETLDLIPDPDNHFDPMAIRVCRKDGQQIGHVPRQRTHEIHEKFAEGYSMMPLIIDLTGGTEDRSIGVDFAVFFIAPGTTDNEAFNRYIEGVLTSKGINWRSWVASGSSQDAQVLQDQPESQKFLKKVLNWLTG